MAFLDEINTMSAIILDNEQFKSLQTNRDRIAFILTKVKPIEEYRNHVFKKADNFRELHRKNLQKSQDLRTTGHEYFKSGNFVMAFNCFTEAILNAPFPSQTDTSTELSIAYQSRCVTFFQNNDYEMALFDVNQVIKLTPIIDWFLFKNRILRAMKKFREAKQLIEQLIEKSKSGKIHLNNITTNALEQLQQFNERDLKMSANIEDIASEPERIDNFWIHPNCQIEETDDRGRVMIVKQFIEKDTQILIELPYNAILRQNSRTKYCNNCFKKLNHKIWPCRACNEVVFCDEECAEEAYNEFHRGECGLAEYFNEMGTNLHMVYKLFTKIGCLNAYNLENIFNKEGFDVNLYLSDERQRGIPHKDKIKSQKFDEYRTALTFEHHNNERTIHHNIVHCFMAIEPSILLNYANVLDFDIIEYFNAFVSLAEIALNNIRRDMCNSFGWFEYPEDPNQDPIHIGHYMSIVSTFVNHSCVPNTRWRIINRRHVFTVMTDMNAGNEIFISYGPTALMPIDERQKQLFDNYFFTCGCIGCSKMTDITRHLFNRMINNIKNGVEVEDSLVKAEKAFTDLFKMTQMIELQAILIMNEMRQLLGILVKSQKFSNAVNHFKQFMVLFVALKPLLTESEILNDLLLWTNIYFGHLKEGTVGDEQQWQTCFGLCAQLIDVLKKQSQTKVSLIRSKSDELQILRSLFAQIFNKVKEFEV